MAYAVLTLGSRTGPSLPLIEASITETAMRGYEWSAQCVSSSSDFDIMQLKPLDAVYLTLYDDANMAMEFPPLAVMQITQDITGFVTLSGMDQTSYKLSQELNPSEDSVYNSMMVSALSTICGQVCDDCNVTMEYSGQSLYLYGIGTVSGTAISVFDRILGLFNHEWTVRTDGRLRIAPLVWSSANVTKTLPTLAARRCRDYEQRKTSMSFSKYSMEVDSDKVTVKNGSTATEVQTYTYTNDGYPMIVPGERTQIQYYNQAYSLGTDNGFVKAEVVDYNAGSEWKLELYSGYPGTEENALETGCQLLGTVDGIGDVITTDSNRPITHARFYREFTYQSTSETWVTVREFPHVDGLSAILRCYTNANVNISDNSFSYSHETNQTPANPDTNIVSDTLWLNRAQCQSLAEGQMWADNRESHTVEYSGPWVLGIHVRDCISHPVFPTARVDKVTYSISSSNATVQVQAAVLGDAQW